MKEDDQSRKEVMEAYALVGAVSTGYSRLEFHLQFILVLLISSKEVSHETTLTIRDRQFSQGIKLFRELIIFKFPKDSALRMKGLDLVKRLDDLRILRNLYVHGYWIINEHILASTGGVRCSDTRWKFDKQSEDWISMSDQDISLDSLRSEISKTKEIFDDLYAYNNLVRDSLQNKPDEET